MVLPTKFLDLTSKLVPKSNANPGGYQFPLSLTYGERGLLGLAFHPDYNRRDLNNQPLPDFGKFYVFYSAPAPVTRGNPTAPATNAGADQLPDDDFGVSSLGGRPECRRSQFGTDRPDF